MHRKFLLFDGVDFMMSGAIPENEVLCTLGSDGRLIFRFWCEMCEDEIIEVLVSALTETAIEAALKKLGCLKKARLAKFKSIKANVPQILTQMSRNWKF
jgi:hypothetical protein